MCLHGALHSIPFNLICNMITFREKNVLTFDPTPGVKGVCKQGYRLTLFRQEQAGSLKQNQ